MKPCLQDYPEIFLNFQMGTCYWSLYTEVKLSHGMRAIHCCTDLEEGTIGADILFIRDFYEDLLNLIRSVRNCVLIGNPGIGKSQFQFYYLARIMNPELFGGLTPDFNGCTDAPKLVIRQQSKTMTVYDVERAVAYECETNELLLECFDPKVTLYLFEPAESRDKPFWSGLKLPSLRSLCKPTLAEH
jgi:hypothetical protein